jgi:hypothetical protein
LIFTGAVEDHSFIQQGAGRPIRRRKRYLGGRVPFGWRVDGDGGLVEIPDEQEAIATMVSLKREGLALRTIAERMTAQGFKLSHEGVKKIVGRLAEQV